MNSDFDIQKLNELLDFPEGRQLECKEAKNEFGSDKVFKYCVALGNEGGGHLVLGVTDKLPRQVVGTNAFQDMQKILNQIIDRLHFRVDITELVHPDGRVLVFSVPSRPSGSAYQIDGAYWMRSGESLIPMTDDKLRSIHAENKAEWLLEEALIASSDEVIALLDTSVLFDAFQLPYPSQSKYVIEKLEKLSLIQAKSNGWTITRMAAILFAKHLDAFPVEVSRKALRVIFYEGTGKQHTRLDRIEAKGYAVAFNQIIEFIHDSAPRNRILEESIRSERRMFPKQAIRELIANALIHQDFSVSGSGVMVEMYTNRIEITNPGKPTISIDRFIDENVSRNERLADLMRRMGFCEEKGSGIDKVIQAAEDGLLPAPDFRFSELRTTAILFSHLEFSKMSKQDRIRACYQHCSLMYIMSDRMTNQSLRNRFKLAEAKTTVATQIISAALEEKAIKLDDSDSTSRRYAKYLPWWA